ncbi:hypothetical protein ERS069948_00286 [Streptococcus pneumoniae]|nr:hypothetical protein ERS069948_00286 [Streptococcus pneumoniae]
MINKKIQQVVLESLQNFLKLLEELTQEAMVVVAVDKDC